MEIRVCLTKEVWETSTVMQTGEFLQSWQWGEFQRSVGHEPMRLQVVEHGAVVWQGQGFVHRLPLGFKYIYFPRIADFRFDMLDFKSLCQKALGFMPVFIRVEPVGQSNISHQTSQIVINRQPKRTLILDVRNTEEELLDAMHQKTRYNIRVAQKHNVEIREEKHVDVFWQLNEQTTVRDAFKSHDKTYYENMLQSSLTRQTTAWYNGVPIASHIHVLFGGVWTYLHGTSSNEFRNVMAPYLLHWYSIQQAKQNGCHTYDFWGIAPAAAAGIVMSEYNGITWQADHGWTGITRYKAGFGGVVQQYPDAYEIPVRLCLYKSIEMIKQLRHTLV